MNMNDSDWNEFWDDEAEDDRDDDEQNDVGSDVDANNDETFDNAAEWNEDEHEELIARDSILSQTARSNNHARENSRNINGRSRGRPNEVLTNHSLNDHGAGNESRRQEFALLATTVGWNNNLSDLMTQAPHYNPNNSRNRFNPQNNNLQWNRSIDATSGVHQHHHMHLNQNPRDLIIRAREPSPPPSFIHDLNAKQHTTIDENSTSILTPNAATCSPQRPKVIRVDDLERQLMKTSISSQNIPNRTPANASTTIPIQQTDQPKRSSWSPFGGKDLFTSTDPQHQQQARVQLNSQQQQNIMSQNLMSRQLSLEQQQRILLQQHQIVQQQQQLQQMALVKQQQELLQQQQLMAQQQQMKKQHEPSRLLPQNAQCFTVEELERQMIADRTNSKEPTKTTVVAVATTTTEKQANLHQQQNQRQPNKGQDSRQTSRQNTHNNSHDRRNGEKYHERSDQKQHQERTHRKDRRDHRDDRENRHYDSRKKFTIIPPQVQLSVIDKERRLHSLTTMHQDEYLQDIMPTSRTGFLFNRHSNVSSEKANHDGILTEKERSWLTRIQEKIQADYDDNVDQDYYYLLYFNRSSRTEGATNQKPSGPGVLDRRFIPRERLLYNTSD